MLADLKIMRTFAPAIERESIGRKIIKIIGAYGTRTRDPMRDRHVF